MTHLGRESSTTWRTVRLLHVGQETDWNSEGEAYHQTVAVLGHDGPPEEKPKVDLSGLFGKVDLEEEEPPTA